jgi:hypothetical protein
MQQSAPLTFKYIHQWRTIMTEYTIQVLNQSGFAKSYVIFQEPPAVISSGADVEVFSNAWVTFPSLLPGGYDKVIYNDVVEAYWGTIPSQLSPTVVVNSGGFANVDTSTQDSVTFQGTSPIGFGSVTSGLAANTGAYQIVANSDFTAANNYVFGMAKLGSTPIPTPVATFLAQPNVTFDVIPVVKFYVSDGCYTEGEIIDVKSFSTQSVTIDFTGLPQTTASIVQAANGSFSVAYS